jgi:RNA polymerase sigma-70 factor (ECF subfamily)
MENALKTAIPANPAALEALMRRHNGRLFRVARAILKDDAAAEDALQDAYVQAFRQSAQFRGDAELSTWLTRIVINQALMMLRKRKRERIVVPFSTSRGAHEDERTDDMANQVPDERAESPSEFTLRAEVRKVIERRIDQLPVAFRTVFVMREVEEMTVQETAECLGIPPSTVRTRLFRARALMREALERDMDTARAGVYGFAGARCDRIVSTVLARLQDDRRE